MRSFDDEGGEVFFDTQDYFRASSASSSPDSLGKSSELAKLEHGIWTGELLSVSERRHRFFHTMGLEELISSDSSCSWELENATHERSVDQIVLERIAESSGAVLDPLSSDGDAGDEGSLYCISDLDTGKKFVIHDPGKEGLLGMLREVGSGRMMTLQEFETFLGLSQSVQQFLQREISPSEEKQGKMIDAKRKNSRKLWRSWTVGGHLVGICKHDDTVKGSISAKAMRTRVRHHKKIFSEFPALCMGQEIQAHKGWIRAMKFSSSGLYLASGGEDCIVRVWQTREVESSCQCRNMDGSFKIANKAKEGKLKLTKKVYGSTPDVIQEKLFKIDEVPLHEFLGHTSDVLDLSWSNSDCLLSSSKDKTVRMWKVGSNQCLKVFHHNDYVTCIQFNPVDARYFISGSIDGKVRIWGVTENHVVNWTDVRNIVTAVCYQHDGKGFVVGSITGNCRFYDYSGNNLQLNKQLHVDDRKKSPRKRITGLQFSQEDSQKIMITSADSKIRIFDGVEVIHKFRGLWRSKSQSSASFTSDGRHIVSVGEDSHVYIWNYHFSDRRGGGKSIRSCELFYSDSVSVAVPWPGMDHRGAGLSKNSLHTSSPDEIPKPSTGPKDPGHCSLRGFLFSDGLSRGSTTWPEEKLISVPDRQECVGQQQCFTNLSASGNLVIVTGSSNGIIRSFHNHGLHVRL